LVAPRPRGRLSHHKNNLRPARRLSAPAGSLREEFAMSQTSMTEPPQIKNRIGAILRATSGNFLEQFDFFLFGFYAP
jgi:MHS family citrate/tricarballylate:H+ symporter-like MFS transporter